MHRLIRRLARRAGLASASALSPHSLRHTAITEILDATGGDLRRAQDFACHADPRTTRRYDRRRDQLDNHGAYLLAGRFGDTKGPLVMSMDGSVRTILLKFRRSTAHQALHCGISVATPQAQGLPT